MGGFNLHFTSHYRFTVICEITIIWGDLMEICFTPGWLHTPGPLLTVSPLGDTLVDLQPDTVVEVKERLWVVKLHT